jgi:hypothetical protein
MANDNEERYRVDYGYTPATRSCSRHGWIVYEGNRRISIAFETKLQAERCKAALIAYDQRWPSQPMVESFR